MGNGDVASSHHMNVLDDEERRPLATALEARTEADDLHMVCTGFCLASNPILTPFLQQEPVPPHRHDHETLFDVDSESDLEETSTSTSEGVHVVKSSLADDVWAEQTKSRSPT